MIIRPLSSGLSWLADSDHQNRLMTVAKSVGLLAAATYATTRAATLFKGGYSAMISRIAQTKSAREEVVRMTRLFRESNSKVDLDRLSRHVYPMKNRAYTAMSSRQARQMEIDEQLQRTDLPITDRESLLAEEKRLKGDSMAFKDDMFYNAAAAEEEFKQRDFPGRPKIDPNNVFEVSSESTKVKELLDGKMKSYNGRVAFMQPEKWIEQGNTAGSALRGLRNEYGPILEWLESFGNVEVIRDKLRRSPDGEGYLVKIRLGRTTADIKLPYFKQGFVKWEGRQMIPVQTAIVFTGTSKRGPIKVGQTVLLSQDFGMSVISDLQESLKSASRSTNARDFANRVHSSINGILNQRSEEMVGSPIGATLTTKLEVVQYKHDVPISAILSGRETAQKYAGNLQDMPLFEYRASEMLEQVVKDIHGSMQPVFTGRKWDFALTSESAFVLRGKGVAAESVPHGTLFRYEGKAAVTRLNLIHGRLRPVEMSEERFRRKVVAQFGSINQDQLERIVKTGEIPGGMTVNTMYWFGDIQGVYEGGSLIIAHEGRDLRARIRTIKDHAKREGRKLSTFEREHVAYLYKRIDQISGENILRRADRVAQARFTVKVKGIVEGVTSKHTYLEKNAKSIMEQLLDIKIGQDLESIQTIPGRNSKGPVTLKPGQVLGVDIDTGQEIRVPGKTHYVIEHAQLDRDGQVTYRVREDYNIAPGGTKMSSTKTVPQAVNKTREALSRLTSDEEIAEGLAHTSFTGDVVGAPSVVMSAEMLKRFEGGGVGEGFMNKILGDVAGLKHAELTKKGLARNSAEFIAENKKLEENLRRIAGILMGEENAAHVIDRVEVTDGVTTIVRRGNIASDDVHFRRIRNLGNTIEDAMKSGDPRALEKLGRDMEQLRKKVVNVSGLDSFQIVGYLRKMDQYTSQSSAYLRNAPAILFSKGGGMQRALNLATHEFIHMESTNRYTRFAAGERGLNGYTGGMRTTIDHIINADMSGLRHYSKFLNTILDHNLTYIEDKIESLADFASQEKVDHHKKNAVWGKTQNKRMRELTMGDFSDGMRESMTDSYVRTHNSAQALRFRVAEGNIRTIAGHLDEDIVKDLADRNTLSIDDLARYNLLGLESNIAGGRRTLYDKKIVDEVVGLLNQAKPGEVTYLKLPMEVNINGTKVSHVPLHRTDRGDMIGLIGEEVITGTKQSKALRAGQMYYTGSAFFQEQMEFIQRIMEIDHNMRRGANDERAMSILQQNLEQTVIARTTALRRAFMGPGSPAAQRLFQQSLPLSGGGVVRGAEGVPDHIAALHPDDMVKFVTGGKITSVEHAERLASELDAMVGPTKRLKHISEWNFKAFEGTNNLDELAKLIQGPDITPKRVVGVAKGAAKEFNAAKRRFLEFQQQLATAKTPPTAEALADITKQVKDAATKLAGALPKTEGEEAYLVGKYATDILEDLGMVRDKTGKLVLPTDTAAYFENSKVIRPIREGLAGAFARSPEIHRASLQHVVFALNGDNRAIPRDLIKHSIFEDQLRAAMKWAEGAVTVSQRSLRAADGDVDKDLVTFVLTSYGYLEEKAKKVGRGKKTFSLIKSLKLDFNMDASKAMQEESVLAMIREKMAFEGAEGLMPSNLSSISMIGAVKRYHHEGDTHVKTPIKQAIADALYGIEGEAPDEKRVERIMKTMLKEHQSLHGQYATESLEDHFIISGYKVAPTKPGNINAARENIHSPGIVSVTKAGQGWSLQQMDSERFLHDTIGVQPEHGVLYDKIHDGYKMELKQLQRRYFKESVENFTRIKANVPIAYRHTVMLRTLSEMYAKDDRERAFMELLGAKKIEQMVLDSKHGAPDIISDIEKWFKRVSSGEPFSEEDINRIAHDHWMVHVTSDEAVQVKAFGKVGIKETREGVRMDKLQEYRETRLKFLGEVLEINKEADEHVQTMLTDGRRDMKSIKAARRNYIEGKVKSMKMVSEHQIDLKKAFLPSMGFTEGAEFEYYQAKTALDSLGKIRKTDFDMIFKDAGERAKLARTMTSYARRYRLDTGQDLGNDDVLRALMSGGRDDHDLSISDVVQHTLDKINDKRARNLGFTARHSPEARMMRVISNIFHMDDVNHATLGPGGDMSEGFETARRREIAAINRKFEQDIAKESTVFRRGSILDSVFGGLTRATKNAETDAMLSIAQRSRAGAVLSGLFLGILAGQTFNQLVRGYPVPDLEHIKGRSGEYYEHKRGIIGSIIGQNAEIMLQPKPARVARMDRTVGGLARDVISVENMQLVMNNNDKRRAPYKNKFRGLVIQ